MRSEPARVTFVAFAEIEEGDRQDFRELGEARYRTASHSLGTHTTNVLPRQPGV